MSKLKAFRDVSCESIVSEYLSRIEAKKELNTFLQVYQDEAFERARTIDKKNETREKVGKLAGMVVAIKDVIALQSNPLTCGSKILENFISVYNATVVDLLLKEDAIIIGKTNCDEFAMGSSNENSAFGKVLNPNDSTCVPGGSSGGSAAAVAADLCDTALGTDTGGSIRQPAAFCGVFGIKPTYGRVSRYGLVAFASSFDTIGPFARSTEDCAKVLEVISGFDFNDSTSISRPVPKFSETVKLGVKELKIGIPKEFFQIGLDTEINNSIIEQIKKLENEGCEIIDISLPHTQYSIATYYILTTAEASANLARFDGVRYGYRNPDSKKLDEMYTQSRSDGFGDEVKRRIMLGTYVLSAGYYDAYYLKGQKVRRLIQNDYIEAFNKVDCIITPTTPTTAFKLGEKISDPLAMYLSDIYTTSANLAGIPGINIPIGFDSKNLPIGMQVLANYFNEEILFRVSYFLEKFK